MKSPTDPRIIIRREHVAADECIVKDVWLDDCYKVSDLPSPITRCIDVGAHIGVFPRKLLDRFPDCRIVSCEPHPDNYEVLSRNLDNWAKTKLNIESTRGAVGEKGKAWLHGTIAKGCLNTGGSFIGSERAHEALPNAAEYVTHHEVPVWSLDEVADVFFGGNSRVDLVKLDCEGSEEVILRNCDLTRYGGFIGEWHHRGNFMKIVCERFPSEDWTFDVLRDGNLGLFRICNRKWFGL